MSAHQARRCVEELVGIAVNTSSLSSQPGLERALDRVAGLGMASLAVRFGADIEDVPVAASRVIVYGIDPDRRDVIAGELSPLLLHIRYGRQFGLVPQAIDLFAQWITYRAVFSAYVAHEHAALRCAFSARAMHEWLSDRCQSCGGSGKHQRSPTGRWLKPWGSMQRNATFRLCDACKGSRCAPIRHPERIKALGLTREAYERERWMQRFNAAAAWLNQLLPSRVVRALTAELERRKRR